MLEGSILSAARCSEGIPPLHEAYENGIGDLKLGRRAVTTRRLPVDGEVLDSPRVLSHVQKSNRITSI